MTFEIWISVVMGILGIGLTVTIALLRVLYSSLLSRINRLEETIETRFRTLIHEDRDIRNQIQGMTKLFFQALHNSKEK